MTTKVPCQNHLEDVIKNLIKRKQFITIEELINLVLHHPNYGYYRSRLPIGKTNDFITAPEITQLFGEMIAFWIIKQWEALNTPSKINIVELGPGNGTMMFDILNIVKRIPRLCSSIHLFLIEVNPHLRTRQENKLLSLLKQYKIKATWLANLNSGTWDKNIPNIFIANEFLDALPVKQFKFKSAHWHEVGVTLQQGEFKLCLDKNHTLIEDLLPTGVELQEDMIFEYSPQSLKYIADLTNLIRANNGAALIIDYGYLENPYTNTIQAISKHQKVNFLNNMGKCDITYLVNFPLIIQQIKALKHNYQITTQNQFLTTLGIHLRTARLLQFASNSQKNAIISGVNRILDQTNMGSLFKVLEIN